jgi:hypothetical protein
MMIGHKTALGLSLLCALAFCAIATSSASAGFGTKALNTTAFTCDKAKLVDKGEFKDGHCDEKEENPKDTKGIYDHWPIIAKVNEKTTIEATSKDTATKTTAHASTTIKFETEKGPVEITCKEAVRPGENSYIENEQKENKHTVTGTLEVDFVKCEVKKPAKCVVDEPIGFQAKFEGVEELGPNKNTMGVEFMGDPDPDSPFMSITLKNKGIEACEFKGLTFDIDGTAIATGAPNPSLKHSGATWKFEPKNEMQTLTVAGMNAELTTTLTPAMLNEYAIPLTTLT